MVITEPAVASARLLGLGSTELYPNNVPASSTCSIHAGFTSAGSRPLDKMGGRVSKKIFTALRASVWPENKRGAGARAPSPVSATVY